MIIGLGSDVIDIRRMERTITKYGDRFIERIFTPGAATGEIVAWLRERLPARQAS